MTPKQREAMISLQRQIRSLDIYLGRLKPKLDTLVEQLEISDDLDNDDFTSEDISNLLRFNQRLTDLERHLRDVGDKECVILNGRVADPADPLIDYDIEATLGFKLRTRDGEFYEYRRNCYTQRSISLKHLRQRSKLADGKDHRDDIRRYPAGLDQTPHCWLFHDLYGYSYGAQSPALSLDDCLRIGEITVNVTVSQQSLLDIETGSWLPLPTETDWD